jgi:hypothetical protein
MVDEVDYGQQYDWISYIYGVGSSSDGEPSMGAYFDTSIYQDWNDVG